jgi:hypothetical protein
MILPGHVALVRAIVHGANDAPRFISSCMRALISVHVCLLLLCVHTLQVLAAMPQGGVAFYNCGEHSGRSQTHKHVQVRTLQVTTPHTLQQVCCACTVLALFYSACQSAASRTLLIDPGLCLGSKHYSCTT